MKSTILIYTLFFYVIYMLGCQQKKDSMKISTFEGEDITSKANIIRDKQSKKARVNIEIDGSWKIYAGYTIDSINLENPVLTGNGKGSFELNVADSVRSYFQFVSERGKAILSEKHLPMTGGFNFRDLGGTRTKDGHYVKWGKLFRTDDLSNLTSQDLNYLSYIPIESIVDFRAKEELIKTPDRIPKSVTNVYELSINPGNLSQDEFFSDKAKSTDFFNLMKDINLRLVSDSACINRYREFFKVLQDEENVPVLYHCTAGKDRTGMATALVYYALGVEDETIISDYLLSNTYLKDKYESIVKRYPQLSPVVSVDSAYLNAGLDKIKADYGTVENYLIKVLDVNISKMRSLYLY